MPKTHAYLRVSTDSQDVANQELGLLAYANDHNLTPVHITRDQISGKARWQEREIGSLITEQMTAGDTLLVSEVSRLGRSTLGVLEILAECRAREINVIVTKQNLVFDDSLGAKITATVLGLAAEIERTLISERTKESLKRLKAEGKTLGRPRGKAKNLRLDDKKDEIQNYVNLGLNRASIARLVGACRRTVCNYIADRRIIQQQQYRK